MIRNVRVDLCIFLHVHMHYTGSASQVNTVYHHHAPWQCISGMGFHLGSSFGAFFSLSHSRRKEGPLLLEKPLSDAE